MTTFEWFLLVVVVIVVPLTVAVVVTLWTIDQANKRKRANRKDAQIGVKRKAALSPDEVEARRAARSALPDDTVAPASVTINNLGGDITSVETATSSPDNDIIVNTNIDERRGNEHAPAPDDVSDSTPSE